MTYFVTYLKLSFTGLQFAHRFNNVVAAHDCITLKNVASPPVADLRDDRFGGTGAAEIPWGGSAKVMKDQTAVACSLESAFRASCSCIVWL